MRLHSETPLISRGNVETSWSCRDALTEVREAISLVTWPPDAPDFRIYPESGKKRGEGSGVRPVRDMFVERLEDLGWEAEVPFPIETPADSAGFGAMDLAKTFDEDLYMVEWESGNISSSHRALNKLTIGLLRGVVTGGILIVPTRELAQYLTDRIGNLRELKPYFELWSSVQVDRGFLAVFAVEHDGVSTEVPRIRKGTDGRAEK